jgi:hypothetical protein
LEEILEKQSEIERKLDRDYLEYEFKDEINSKVEKTVKLTTPFQSKLTTLC